MADKTPVRVVFNASNVATGMAEFQSGDTVPVASGGTGLSSIGSAGQIIKVNAAGNALEFGAEGDLSITNLVAPTNADLTLSTSGTGNIVLDQITLRGTTFSSTDSSSININEGLIVDGTLIVSGQATLSGLAYPTSDGTVGQFLKTNGSGTLSFANLSLGDLTIIGSTISAPSNGDLTLTTSGSGIVHVNDSFKIGSGATVTTILDEDAMGSNSATSLATQQSIKAYVDSSILTKDNTDEIAEGSSNLYFTNARADARITAALIDEDNMASNSATRLPSQQSVKAYIDAQNVAQALTFVGDDSTGTAVNSGETFQIAGGTGLTSAVVNDTMTLAIDSTVATLSGSQSLTNKTLTSPVLDTGVSGTAVKDEDNMSSNSATALATQQSIKAYVDAQDANIASDTLTLTNKTFDVEATGNSISNIDVSDLKSGVLDTDITSVSGSDDTLASAKAIKTYVDSQVTAQDLDIAADDSTAIAIDLDSEVLQVSGGSGITTSATGNTITVSMDTALTVNSLVSGDSSSINIKDGLDIDGTLTLASGTGVNNILDEDDMSSNSATALATQQSIKAYVDAQDAAIASDTLTLTNKTFDVEGTGNSISNIDVADFKAAAIVIESEGIGSNDNDTTLPTSAAVKDYADTKAVLTGSTNNTIATVTGAHALNGEANLTFDGSTLAVTGAATVSTTLGVTGASTLDGVTITDNTISTNASNAPLEIIANGTGPVVITSGGVAFTLPTTDGSAGEFLKTDGSGTLSFGSSAATSSDDTRVVTKNNKSVSTSPRTVDYFQSSSADMAWYFIALNDLTNDRSSASCFTVAHNNTDAFVSGARGGSSGSNNSLPTTTADISSGQVRVKIAAPSADSKISYYKIPISRANTADATAGVTVTTSNTDVDSSSESIDTFAHASFRAAKYLIIIDDNAKTETGVTEALVVHDGSNAFVTQHGTINTGNNDMITLSASISGSNVVLSAAGLTPNLSLKIHKTLLSDSMSAVSNANQKIIGATTVSSSATAFDSFDLDDATAAMYYVVGGNGTEGHYSVQEVYCSGAPGEAAVSQGPFVSTKGTVQLEFTAAFDADEDNTLQMSVSSTSGGSTTVNAYRINCLAE
jgi:hypothetical protein